MTLHTDHPTPLPAVRQLRRMRAFYAAGVTLWTASTAWTGWDSPGSRPMWTSLLLLAVFAGLLVMACRWLRNLENGGTDGRARRREGVRSPAPGAGSCARGTAVGGGSVTTAL
ncbi:hypothetical protein MQN93_27590 [Streptomyces sp. 7R016]|uniref:Uncharacterized protein n=1 Tax=Streptomyces spinosisporus TaxID=2927582 RepID=A0ABS9XNE0_9ACTN|nr:hypothetical protein [Streptomyces spinosisporus]MCI3243490.1 hypothetical protein [Streptomyces spinosisporus]